MIVRSDITYVDKTEVVKGTRFSRVMSILGVAVLCSVIPLIIVSL